MPERSLEKTRERRDYERTASIISGALAVVGSSDLAMKGLTTAVKRIVKTDQQQIIADWLKEYTSPGHPGQAFFKNIRHLHPNVRKRFVAGMMANLFMRDPEYTTSLLEEKGISSPTVILISPSMRCNLKCVGCYASEYDDEDELTEEQVEDIINQGEAIGTRVFVMLGGEPIVWKPLMDIIERHPQSVFMVFTNATMINDRMADRIVELGNICPTISIEGGKKPPTPAVAKAPTTASWPPWTVCANAAPWSPSQPPPPARTSRRSPPTSSPISWWKRAASTAGTSRTCP